MAKLEIEVGSDLRSAAAEISAAWKAAIAGESVRASDRIVFIDWRALCAVLTADRYDLLRVLAKSPKSGTSDVACTLCRDAHAIEDDVEVLVAIGLVSRDQNGYLTAKVDEIAPIMKIAV